MKTLFLVLALLSLSTLAVAFSSSSRNLQVPVGNVPLHDSNKKYRSSSSTSSTVLFFEGNNNKLVYRKPKEKFAISQIASVAALSNPYVSKSLAVKAASVLIGLALAITTFVKVILDNPSRTYGDGTVGDEYDAWTTDGILEYYWGEHIHLGYYSASEMKKGYLRKNIIQAKVEFINEMMKFGNISPNDYTDYDDIKVLDVGCGFGGTSRYLAKALGVKSNVTGITLSPKQVERGTELASEQGVGDRTKFVVMNALDMEFPDNTFDIVWACESGEHMPDKKVYIEEMMRVLKPGGKFVMACWSQRDDTIVPFDARDKRDLQYLYEEWTHPYFISVNDWTKLIKDTGLMTNIKNANWVKETIASWRHTIWAGALDPLGWIFKFNKYLKIFRDAYCLERMHRAFHRGLMEYGMFAATKKI
jgi:MPBQ/MSBQ methyltransferase